MHFPRFRLALACALMGSPLAAGRGQTAVPLADSESGAMRVRAFQLRDYQGSPVVVRVRDEPT